jgi:hypothetical protein
MQRRIRQLKIRHRIDVDLGALAALTPPWGTLPRPAPEMRDEPKRDP